MIIKRDSINEILTALVVISSISLRNFPYLLYVIQILFITLCGPSLIQKTNKGYLLNRILLITFILLSVIWAFDFNYYLKSLLSIIQIFVITILIFGYIDSPEKINKMISYIIIAGVVLTINLLISTPLSEWKNIIYYSSSKIVDISSSQGRLGKTVSMHPNSFACSVLICLFCVFYRILNTKERKFKYILLFMTLLFLLVLSKSRSTLIEMIIGLGIIFVFNEKSGYKKFFYILICIVFGIACLNAIMKIPTLYNLVGYRMEGLFNIFNKVNGSADASTKTRLDFIKIGIEIFKEKPLLGLGMNNFAIYANKNYNTWSAVYAHNNYIEMLCDIGLIGSLIYYYMWIKSFFLIKKIRNTKRHGNEEDYKILSFTLSLFLVLLIIEFSHITYDNECFQYLLTVIFATGIIYKNKNKKEEKYEK